MVFTREKNDTSNQNRERCFFTCEKNDTSNQKPQRCVSFAPKFPPFIAACSAASHTFNEKSFTLRSLVRFLIRQQLVRKYRTPALSMKYSLYPITKRSNDRVLFCAVWFPVVKVFLFAQFLVALLLLKASKRVIRARDWEPVASTDEERSLAFSRLRDSRVRWIEKAQTRK